MATHSRSGIPTATPPFRKGGQGGFQKAAFLAAMLVFCGVLYAGELEYVLNASGTLTWTVLQAYPVGGNPNHVRLMTKPASGHLGALSRLAVFRNKKPLGFVRIRQSYNSGCVVGWIGRSMNPSDIKSGDLLRSFKIIARKKTVPRKLRSKERRKIERAVSNLGHDAYSVRQKATASLESRGKEVLPFIERLCDSDDPEIRIRANDIFDSITNRERIVEPGLAAVLMRPTGQNKPTDKMGFLGISMSDVEKGAKPGTLVLGVIKDMPAEKIGLRADDIILSVDGEILNDSTDLREIIAGKDPGCRVKLVVKRKEEEIKVDVELTSRSAGPSTIQR